MAFRGVTNFKQTKVILPNVNLVFVCKITCVYLVVVTFHVYDSQSVCRHGNRDWRTELKTSLDCSLTEHWYCSKVLSFVLGKQNPCAVCLLQKLYTHTHTLRCSAAVENFCRGNIESGALNRVKQTGRKVVLYLEEIQLHIYPLPHRQHRPAVETGGDGGGIGTNNDAFSE